MALGTVNEVNPVGLTKHELKIVAIVSTWPNPTNAAVLYFVAFAREFVICTPLID